MDIEKIIGILQQKRNVFFSEADFQFALAWEIQQFYSKSKIRLEYCAGSEKNMYIDIIVELENKIYPIELKYKTKKTTINDGDETYNLKDQGAQDIGKYDYLKDIQRIEYFKNKLMNFEYGVSIILTNDPSYWKKNKIRTIDEAFYLLNGIIKHGKMKWAVHASKGTTKGRAAEISLSGSYKIEWKEYSNYQNVKNGLFKYCVNITEK